MREMEEGLAAHTITRSALLRPYYLSLLAGALIRLQRYDDARRALDDSASIAAATASPRSKPSAPGCRERFARLPGQDREADEAFREALAISRAQKARWFELRSARGYADFLVNRRRTDEARDLLAVLAWFS